MSIWKEKLTAVLLDALYAIPPDAGTDRILRERTERYVAFITDPANRDVVLRAMGGEPDTFSGFGSWYFLEGSET
jgi:hypothetical protein